MATAKAAVASRLMSLETDLRAAHQVGHSLICFWCSWLAQHPQLDHPTN